MVGTARCAVRAQLRARPLWLGPGYPGKTPHTIIPPLLLERGEGRGEESNPSGVPPLNAALISVPSSAIGMSNYDLTKPWNLEVSGEEVLPLINDDAPVIRVEAGPGTGKTFGLRRRVLRLLHPDGLKVSGEKVAVVAFNRVIAKELQNDIKETLKEAAISDMPLIETVHGFCLKLLRVDLRMLLDHEREAMLYDVLHEFPDFKRSYKSHSKTAQALHDHEAHLASHLKLWQAVRRWLNRHKAHLVSDLPGLILDRSSGLGRSSDSMSAMPTKHRGGSESANESCGVETDEARKPSTRQDFSCKMEDACI